VAPNRSRKRERFTRIVAGRSRPASRRKTWWAFPGWWRLRCAPTAGICGRTSFGTRPTRCPRA
jgi:hypothetical protein